MSREVSESGDGRPIDRPISILHSRTHSTSECGECVSKVSALANVAASKREKKKMKQISIRVIWRCYFERHRRRPRKSYFVEWRGSARHTLNTFRTYIDDDDDRRHLTNNHFYQTANTILLFFFSEIYFCLNSTALDFAGVLFTLIVARSFVFRLIWKLNTNNVMSQHYTMDGMECWLCLFIYM